MIFGLYALAQLLANRFLRAALLLTLCFYTHIGVSWFLALSMFFFGLCNKQYRRLSLWIPAVSLFLSAPIIFKQLIGLQLMSLEGINERHFIEFKALEYLLAFFALGVIINKNKDKKYYLFAALFIASFVFLPYPYRFISAQGYLPVVFLSAVGIDSLRERYNGKSRYLKYAYLLAVSYCLLFSVTLFTEKGYDKGGKISSRAYYADTALMDMVFPLRNARAASQSLWFPDEYALLTRLIARHSEENDIIYSELLVAGVALAGISGRVTANGLFPEISPIKAFNPLAVSKLLILPKDEALSNIKGIAWSQAFIKIGEGTIFAVYKNSLCRSKAKISKASISFRALSCIFLIFTFLFWQAQKIEGFLKKRAVFS